MFIEMDSGDTADIDLCTIDMWLSRIGVSKWK